MDNLEIEILKCADYIGKFVSQTFCCDVQKTRAASIFRVIEFVGIAG
jgi:hypothetical protein